MTKLLEQAVERARELPESEQDAIAQIILDELESERRWDDLFAKAPETLSKLADEAWAEHGAGESQPLDPEPCKSDADGTNPAYDEAKPSL